MQTGVLISRMRREPAKKGFFELTIGVEIDGGSAGRE